MPDKPKIAICVSGQTRHFNADPQYTEDFNNVLGLFDDFEYDLFGHTWSDQENPHPEVLERFTDYRSDDQKVIWDTIIDSNSYKNPEQHPHWSQFFTPKRDWLNKKEYQDILNGTSDTSYIDFAKERINGHCGQVWSAMESFLLTKHKHYDFVVRIRWDSKICDEPSEFTMPIEEEIKQFKHTLWAWINQKEKFNLSPLDNASCLVADDCLIENNRFYANDMLYVIKGNVLRNIIDNYTTIHVFEKMLNEAGHYVAMSHELWADWLDILNLRCVPALNNLIRLNGDFRLVNDPVSKPNKKWRA